VKKNRKRISLISILPILIGIGVIVLSGFYSVKNRITFTNKVYTEGVITKITDNKVYVKYEVSGLIRQKEIAIEPKKVHEKQIIKVYYNKNNPSSVYTDTSDETANKLFKIGIGIIILGIIFFFYSKRRNKYHSNLRVSGRKISATIKEIKVNKGITRNGQNPHIVVCSWINPEDNKEYLFNSPKVWGNPGELMSIKNISFLTVYVDKNDFTRYEVDIDPLN